jgi:hypothetical protein
MIFEYLIMFLVAFQQISPRFFLHQLSLLDKHLYFICKNKVVCVCVYIKLASKDIWFIITKTY